MLFGITAKRAVFVCVNAGHISYLHGVKPIRNIIFDLGGVLLPVDYPAVLNAFAKLGPEQNAGFYSQQSQQPLFDRLERGEITAGEFLFGLRQIFPDASEQDLNAAWNAILGIFPQNRLDLLDKVRRHYRIFLLSNTNEIHVREILTDLKNRLGVEDFATRFEEVYYSHETGFRKPEREIFELVLLENNLDASETLFIEDTEANAVGAVNAGIPTLWLRVTEGASVETLFDGDGKLTETFPEPNRLLLPETGT